MIAPAVAVEILGPDGSVIPVSPTPHVYDWFLVPQGEVTVERRTATRVTLKLSADRGPGRIGRYGEELPDAPVGTLPIATLNPNSGQLETVTIPLPPPAPMTTSDVNEMWEALASLPASARGWVRRRALWDDVASTARPSEYELFVASLPGLLASARHLVTHWPQQEDHDTFWRSVELPGGREDLPATLRRLGPRGGMRELDGWVPERSLRRRGGHKPWRLAAVAALAAEVSRRVNIESISASERVTAPLQAVASVARPTARQADPSPSSWPPQLRAFHDAALNVLAALTASARGQGHAPLCHLWTLYEGWVTSQVLRAVARHKDREPDVGPVEFRRHRGGVAWYARWEDDAGVIDVWGQLNIGASENELCGDPAFTIRSVTSTLIPDALVVIRRETETRVVAVDAKFRTGRLDADDASSTASKYLWGLRAVRDNEEHRLDEVILVTSGDPVQPYDSIAARSSVQRAVPHLALEGTPALDLSPHLD